LFETSQLPFRVIALRKITQAHTQRSRAPCFRNRDGIAALLHLFRPYLRLFFIAKCDLDNKTFQRPRHPPRQRLFFDDGRLRLSQ